jgi:uncharacterized protein YbaR (Trm112 family)
MIAKDLLDILACPQCKTQLTLIADGQKLKCNQCLRVFPIRDGIPILLIDEAVIETRYSKLHISAGTSCVETCRSISTQCVNLEKSLYSLKVGVTKGLVRTATYGWERGL